MGDNASMYEPALGGATKAYGQYEAGETNAKLARYNASIAELQGRYATQAGAEQKNVEDLKAKRIAGSLAASTAGQGVVVGAGTSAAVAKSSEEMTEMDKLMIDINASRKAFGYNVHAFNYGLQADLDKERGTMGALTSLMDTGTTMAEMQRKKDLATGANIPQRKTYNPATDGPTEANTEFDSLAFGGESYTATSGLTPGR